MTRACSSFLPGSSGCCRANPPTKTTHMSNAKETTVPSVNRVTLIGHLGHEPEVRYTPKKTAVLNLRIATNRRWKDRESDELKERTDWHRVVVFGKHAEALAEHATKGAQLYVDGPLQTREWTDKDQVKRHTTEVVGRTVFLLGKKTADVGAPPATEEPEGEPEPPEDIPF